MMGGGREESKMLEEDAKGELPANRLARFSMIGLCSSLLEALVMASTAWKPVYRSAEEREQ